ncbi:hypothetical protein DFH06DRAFT_1323322 [Mycena polygramma]|nr:hypothetical protein DFH06DRAFT_1323322 [Mycena polygramma]
MPDPYVPQVIYGREPKWGVMGVHCHTRTGHPGYVHIAMYPPVTTGYVVLKGCQAEDNARATHLGADTARLTDEADAAAAAADSVVANTCSTAEVALVAGQSAVSAAQDAVQSIVEALPISLTGTERHALATALMSPSFGDVAEAGLATGLSAGVLLQLCRQWRGLHHRNPPVGAVTDFLALDTASTFGAVGDLLEVWAVPDDLFEALLGVYLGRWRARTGAPDYSSFSYDPILPLITRHLTSLLSSYPSPRPPRRCCCCIPPSPPATTTVLLPPLRPPASSPTPTTTAPAFSTPPPHTEEGSQQELANRDVEMEERDVLHAELSGSEDALEEDPSSDNVHSRTPSADDLYA